MRNPLHIVRERYQLMQWNLLNMRHGRAWAGFLLIIGVALIAVIAMIYAVIVESKHQGMEPIDNDDGKSSGDEDNSGGGIWRNIKGIAPTTSQVMLMSTAASTPGAAEIAAPQGMHAMPIVTQTIFSTTTVHVTSTSSTMSLTAESGDNASMSHSTENTTDASETYTDSVMTGDMFCPATNRPNNVYMPCPYVHSYQPGMVDATALPGAVVKSSASHRRVHNPCSTLLRGLPKFIDANREISKSISRLTQFSVWSVRINAAEFLHPEIPSLAKRTGACAIKGDKLRQLLNELEELRKKNRHLHDSIYSVRDIIGIQQELLEANMGIIEKQRIQIEEATRFKDWWAQVHNHTDQYGTRNRWDSY